MSRPAQRLDGTGPGSTGLTGQLTVRGVTRPAVIAAELTGAGPGLDGTHLVVLAGWGIAGAVLGVRRFRWNPRPE